LKYVSRHLRSPMELLLSKEALVRRQGQWPSTNATQTLPSLATIFSLVLLDRRGTWPRLHVTVRTVGILPKQFCSKFKDSCFPPTHETHTPSTERTIRKFPMFSDQQLFGWVLETVCPDLGLILWYYYRRDLKYPTYILAYKLTVAYPKLKCLV